MLTGKSFVADNMWREVLLPVSQRDVGKDFPISPGNSMRKLRGMLQG
jgi:hypothetical protein